MDPNVAKAIKEIDVKSLLIFVDVSYIRKVCEVIETKNNEHDLFKHIINLVSNKIDSILILCKTKEDKDLRIENILSYMNQILPLSDKTIHRLLDEKVLPIFYSVSNQILISKQEILHEHVDNLVISYENLVRKEVLGIQSFKKLIQESLDQSEIKVDLDKETNFRKLQNVMEKEDMKRFIKKHKDFLRSLIDILDVVHKDYKIDQDFDRFKFFQNSTVECYDFQKLVNVYKQLYELLEQIKIKYQKIKQIKNSVKSKLEEKSKEPSLFRAIIYLQPSYDKAEKYVQNEMLIEEELKKVNNLDLELQNAKNELELYEKKILTHDKFFEYLKLKFVDSYNLGVSYVHNKIRNYSR